MGSTKYPTKYPVAKKVFAYRERISSESRKLVWALNYLIMSRFNRRVDVPYTKLNFQICQFLMRRGIFTEVILYKGCRGDSVQGAISVKVRLFDNKKPYAKAVFPKFKIVKPTGRSIPVHIHQGLSWWKLKPYRYAKLVVIKTAFGLMTAHECVYYRIGGRILLILY